MENTVQISLEELTPAAIETTAAQLGMPPVPLLALAALLAVLLVSTVLCIVKCITVCRSSQSRKKKTSKTRR